MDHQKPNAAVLTSSVTVLGFRSLPFTSFSISFIRD